VSAIRRIVMPLFGVVGIVGAATILASAGGRAYGYGPVPHAPVIAVSASQVAPGGSLVVIGEDFTPNASATLSLHSSVVDLGTVATDAHGRFETTVTVPPNEAPGQHTVQARDVPTGDIASASITVTPLPAIGQPPPESGGGSLAGTGVQIAGLVGVALALLVAGKLVTASGRRRGARV
jgi:hypothetical protein